MGNKPTTSASGTTQDAPSPLDKATANSLMEASGRGDVASLRRLLEQAEHAGLDVPLVLERTVGSWKMTALHNAAEAGKLEAVRFLLAQGAPLHVKTDRNNTPLNMALRHGHDACGVAILEHALLGLNWQRVRLIFIGYRKGRNDGCPFAHIPKDVCRLIAVEVMKGSVTYQDLWNSRNADSLRPIDYCARNDCYKSLRLLLRLGISAREVNANPAYASYTPLHFAAANGSLEATRVILQAGAVVDALNLRHETPLYRACCAVSDCPDVVKLLVERGADPEAQANGRSALMEAEARRHTETAAVLRKAIEAKRAQGIPATPVTTHLRAFS